MQNQNRRRGAQSSNFSSRVKDVGRNILVVTEGRGSARGEIGMAFIFIESAQMILSQFSDNLTYTRTLIKINNFSPYELIVSTKVGDTEKGENNRLHDAIKTKFPDTPLITIQRKFFNEQMGLSRIKSLVAPSYSQVVNEVSNKPYSLQAFAVAVKYAEVTLALHYSRNCVKFVFQGSDETVVIDSSTSNHLELFENVKDPNSHLCLFGKLNKCFTPGGERILKINILEPPCQRLLINLRLDIVTAIKKNTKDFYLLEAALWNFPMDLDQIISTLIRIYYTGHDKAFENKINSLIALNQALTHIPSLADAIRPLNHEYFQNVLKDLCSEEIGRLQNKLQETINLDARVMRGALQMQEQRIFIVKPYISDLLDISRVSYNQVKEQINIYLHDFKEQSKLNVKLSASKSRGYYFQMSLNEKSVVIPRLPKESIRVTRLKNSLTFTTHHLIFLDQRLTELRDEIVRTTEKIINELVRTIRQEISSLYQISEHIGNLDYFYSLAHYAISNTNSVRPTFSFNSTAIVQGEHPFMTNNPNSTYVPNNIIQTLDTNGLILTGPNMSGKTTLLRQYATLQILAQMGSFVPAKSAQFRLTDSILSRMGSGDRSDKGTSSFQLEMTEMSHILKNTGPKSLVIIDELGRGTSIREATLLCYPLIEKIIAKKSFLVFVTHLSDLTQMGNIYFSIRNFTMETLEETRIGFKRTLFTRALKRGTPQVEFYGIEFSAECNSSEQVNSKAREIAENLSSGKRGNEERIVKGRLCYEMTSLLKMNLNENSDEVGANLFSALKNKWKRD